MWRFAGYRASGVGAASCHGGCGGVACPAGAGDGGDGGWLATCGTAGGVIVGRAGTTGARVTGIVTVGRVTRGGEERPMLLTVDGGDADGSGFCAGTRAGGCGLAGTSVVVPAGCRRLCWKTAPWLGGMP